MNVDDSIGVLLDKLIGQNLHVASQDDEVRIAFGEEFQDLLFGLRFAVFGYGDGDIGNPIEVCDGAIVFVVGNDQRDLAFQFAALMAVEQVYKAVVVF